MLKKGISAALLAAFVLAVAAAGGSAMTSAKTGDSLKGAGSTFVSPLVSVTAQPYEGLTGVHIDRKRIQIPKHLMGVADSKTREQISSHFQVVADGSVLSGEGLRKDRDLIARTYLHLIPNYGERYRHGEAITTSFVESTVNKVVSKRFCKKQQRVRHEVAERNERMATMSVALSCIPGT